METQAEKIGMDELLKLPIKDRVKAIDEGRFEIPSATKDPEGRKRWDEFGKREPESAPAKEAEKDPEVKPEPVEEPKKDDKAEKPKSRFQSVEEAERELSAKDELIVNQNKAIAESKTAIESLSAQASEFGKTAERLKAELDELKKSATSKQADKADDIEIPEPPEAPDSEDAEKYPEGLFDEKYLKDQRAFNKASAEWYKGTAKAFKQLSSLRKEIAEVKPKLQEIDDFKKTSIEERTRNETQRVANEIDAVIDQVQKDIGLKTSVPWKQIDSDARIVRDEKSPSEIKAAAAARIKALSNEDRQAFQKLVEASQAILEGGRPRFKVGSETYRGALKDAGFSFVQPAKKKDEVDLTKVQHEKPGVSGVPASVMGSDDSIKDLSKNEKYDRLEELGKRCDEIQKRGLKVQVVAPDLWIERMKLRRELGMSLE
jgi:hypothetical protein